jgi:5-methyltetrahydrofolate--homocysteine methyltransferase
MDIFEHIYDAIVERNEANVIRLSNEILKKDIDPIEAIEKGYRRGMEKIGNQFQNLEIYLPEMIAAANVMKKGIDIIRPALKKSKVGSGKILLGTIEGDVHDIGKNIVKIVLEGGGFEVIDLGKDVKILTFVDRCKELNPDIVAISALLTTTMENIPKVIEDLERSGLKDEIKIMVGGAPVLPDWAKQIGADGCGENASQAASLAKAWLSNKD